MFIQNKNIKSITYTKLKLLRKFTEMVNNTACHSIVAEKAQGHYKYDGTNSAWFPHNEEFQ